jgi:hypothetical protein
MIRHGGAAPISMAILDLRTALADVGEADELKDAAHFSQLEHRWLGHSLRGDGDALRAHEIARQIRLAILQQHPDDFPEILLKLVERFCSRVRADTPGHNSHKQPGFRTTLDDGWA